MKQRTLLTWVRGCACGRVHIDVWADDGSRIDGNDADMIRSLRDAAKQIERKTATRTPPAEHNTTH